MNRKRDVVLKFNGPSGGSLVGSTVNVIQKTNSFPLGSCISRKYIDNEGLVKFFVDNFNWAVFAKELTWDWIDPNHGHDEYIAVDELLNLCLENSIQVRGHCIFSEVEEHVPLWVRTKSPEELNDIIDEYRLKGLLTRYKGKFKHYVVNNEMLRGSFYQAKLGNNIRSAMFKRAHELDPDALLFVNDYHIEDVKDTRSTPEKYMSQILDLQAQGAPVGGIGIQGHIDCPVGPIICAALDKLGSLGLPIWITELDVSSINEHVRADDLEVMLREVYAHPAVGGVVLWGFWEMCMARQNSHLVNADGDLNEAGRRLLQLKQEWTSCHDDGVIDENGEFRFRGFPGEYEVKVITPANNTVVKTVTMDGSPSFNIDLENI